MDLSLTVGWIATTAHFMLDIDNISDPKIALSAVCQQARAVPMNGLGYELLLYLADDPQCAEIVKPIQAMPRPHAFFNYMGDIGSGGQDQPAILKPVPGSSILERMMKEWHDQRFHPLEITAMLGKNNLVMEFHHGPDVYERATMENLAKLYRENLLALINSFR